jgi:hypothetical protein
LNRSPHPLLHLRPTRLKAGALILCQPWMC